MESIKYQNPPWATYRFQFHKGFTFNTARKLIPYLEELGISHLYASPLFRARKGSLHGYSVTNPLELNPELGTRGSFDALITRLHSRNMGIILDVVPNHMALSHDNPWWADVLENGPGSPYAPFFDIDWDPPYSPLKGKVLIPILGQPFGKVLEDQEIQLTLGEKGFFFCFYEHQFPLDPKTYSIILTHRMTRLEKELDRRDPALLGLMGLINLIENLPLRTEKAKTKLIVRIRQTDFLKRSLWFFYQRTPGIKKYIDENIKAINGRKGDPYSFDLLSTLLQAQSYWLAFWRVSLEMINYRRFFSINDLISIRVEDPPVFEATHTLLFNLLEERKIDGLRIDHIDGLYDPQGYFLRLRQRIEQEKKGEGKLKEFYLVVEDILSGDETVPEEWPVSGTTGYDFMARVNSLFIDDQGLKKLQVSYDHFIGARTSLQELMVEKKILIMQSLFGGEIETFEYQLRLLADQDRQARDVSRHDLLKALMEVTACLPIYRTYIREFEVSIADRRILEETLDRVQLRNPQLNPQVLQFLRRVLLLDFPAGFSSEQKQGWLKLVMRWQQFTGPIMAKGLEDTALYVYNPLISLNEVGGSHRALSLEAFHWFNQERQRSWPLTMNASSTHDTKRSEDVRARISVLSEIPDEWRDCLKRWHHWNLAPKTKLKELLVPDLNEETFLYQTLIGAWPLFREEEEPFKERFKVFLIKAAREAKVHTRWITPDEDYEKALLTFTEAILENSEQNQFLHDFRKVQSRLAYYGALNSLSQLLLKITSPGIPDFYQGTELWDFSLVDPDNRRPVDFEKRSRLLRKMMGSEKGGEGNRARGLLNHWKDGRIKLDITRKALRLRKNHNDIFIQGDYLPLAVEGSRKKQVVSFARTKGQEWVISGVGRFYSRFSITDTPPLGRKAWGNGFLLLPPEAPEFWTNILTGEELTAVSSKGKKGIPLGSLFLHLPIALLHGRVE